MIKGKTVTIKIKTVKFDVKTRASSLPDYTNDAEVIFMVAKDLLCKEIKNVHPQPLQLRLMGKDILHIQYIHGIKCCCLENSDDHSCYITISPFKSVIYSVICL